MQLIEKNAGNFFTSGDLPQLFEHARMLPPHLRAESPFLCIAAAWAGLATNHQSEVSAWLNAIESHFKLPAKAAIEDPTLDVPIRAALLEVLVVRLQLPFPGSAVEKRAHLLAIRDLIYALPPEQFCLFNPVENFKPVIAFNLGLQAEENGDLPLAVQAFSESAALAHQPHNNNLFHLSSGHLANIQFTQGKLHAARQAYDAALAEATSIEQTASPFAAIAHAGLGALHYEWNDLAAASQHFHEGLALARLWNLWEGLVPLALGQARLEQRQGNIQAALRILDELDSPPRPGLDLALRARAACLRDPVTASAWLAETTKTCTLEPTPTNEGFLLEIARLMACLHRTEEALALLQKIIRFSQNSGRTQPLIRAKVAQAMVGNRPDILVEALQLAEPEGYLSTFLDEGEPLQKMLAQISKKARLEPSLSAYVGKLLSAFEPARAKPARSAGMREQLTERELEVLRCMAEGLSNPQIAARLVLSTNTLKAHAQNIFQKMDVHNRLQAVTKAKELGVIQGG